MNTLTPFRPGAMIQGFKLGNNADARQAHDFYRTPEECTEAFLAAEAQHLRAACGDRVWEPACGDGKLARVLEGHGFTVIGTDLIPRGYGTGRRDFMRERKPRARGIVTNPPFLIAQEFIEHALDLCPDYVAMFLKATFFHAAERLTLFNRRPPAMIYPLTWRPDFLDLGKPAMECCWVVWRRGHATDRRGASHYRPLVRGATL